HLTVSRYYTPSGRCIQKPYTNGEDKEYEYDILNRYQHGEFFNEDSIRQSGQVYTTSIGRTVYGGGGIMPDYFVAEDTTMYTSYYQEAASRGLITQFCFNFTDTNRPRYAHLTSTDEILRQLRHDRVINQFIDYCDSQGLRRRNNLILRSQPLLELVIHGSILYNFLDMEEYLKFINQSDRTIQRAIELYNEGATTPTLPADAETTAKKTACASPRPAIRSGLLA
ncbi:MAG: peptidase S41, partial [Bacteroidaceae bacterium]|nr:peptidase S41 [Bacteroidaceae bacterium]